MECTLSNYAYIIVLYKLAYMASHKVDKFITWMQTLLHQHSLVCEYIYVINIYIELELSAHIHKVNCHF